MNNYKELVASLREEAEAVQAVEWDIPICTSNHIAEAADVIEQDNEIIASLQREIVETAKERGQWMTLGHLANKRSEDYREMRRQRDKAIKERDAAIADLKVNWLCAVCKKRVVTKEWKHCDNKDFYEAPCEATTCLNFEWRGVGED